MSFKLNELFDEVNKNLANNISKELFLTYYNSIAYEIALNYVRLEYTEFFNTNEVYFSQLSKIPVRIVNAETSYINNTQKIFSKDVSKVLGNITYNILPKDKENLDDYSEFSRDYILAFVYGIMEKYYMQNNEREVAMDFRKQYNQHLYNAVTCNKIIKLNK